MIQTIKYRNTNLLLLVVLLIVLTTASCKKENPSKVKGPEDYRVSYDKLTFGAYVNGEPWVPDFYDVGNGIGPIDFIFLEHSNNTVKLRVVARKSYEHLHVFVPADLNIGRFEFNTNGGTHPIFSNPPAYGLFQKYYPSKEYKTNTQYTGYINITKYNRNYPQFEATFEFNAVNPSTGDTLRITNGYLRKD